ncbi:endonuclease domain-containing protein [Sphingorhabdus sp. EL138]|uniref:endonuclease domain-containing protein n=1 Tax=Sphingorhabdus sp. EL138 TaxID=2073156 RepID=UPI0025CB9F70|nr:endonuclease domain-containing protein [Sphingorhabdus sp. EL138]
MSPPNPSPLAGEGGARRAAVGECGVVSRQATSATLAQVQSRHELLKNRARSMRANPTVAERKLWYILRDKRLNGLRWRRQQVIDDRYIVDFICFEHRVIIEADGSQHAENDMDAARDTWLKQQGFTVLRFWNADIFNNMESVVETIIAALQNNAAQTCGDPTPNPLPQGERALERSQNV